MKKLSLLLLFSVLSIVNGEEKEFNKEPYAEVEKEILKAKIEKYYNKKIVLTTNYIKYETTFSEYIEKSGFKSEKYYGLVTSDKKTLYVLIPKRDDKDDVIPKLKSGSKIALYGRVKKFKKDPKYKDFPLYYLDLEHIEVLIENNNKKDNSDSNNNKRKKRRRKRR